MGLVKDGKLKLSSSQILLRLILPALLALAVITIVADSIYILGGLLAVGAFWLLARDKAWLLVAVAPLSLAFGSIVALELRPGWTYEMTIAEILIAVVALVVALDLWFRPESDYELDGISLALLIYTVLAAFSYLWADSTRLYLAGLKVPLFALLAYVSARYTIDSDRKRRIFLAGIAMAAAVFALEIFWTFRAMGFSSKIFFARSEIKTPVGAIALVSALIVFLLPLVLAYSQTIKDKLERNLTLAAFGLGWLGAFLTLGKSAIVSLGAGLLYLIWKLPRLRLPLALFTITFAVAGLAVLTPVFSGLYTRLATAFTDTNASFRLEEYRTAVSIIADHPVLGVGSGQQLLYYQRRLNPYHREFVNNYFLQSAIDYGAVGLAALFGIIIGVLSLIFRRASGSTDIALKAGLTASIIVAALNGLFEVTFFAVAYALVFWLVMGGMSRKIA